MRYTSEQKNMDRQTSDILFCTSGRYDMRRIVKIVSILGLACIILVVGLTIFIRLYLTDDRIKAYIIPEAEKALDRSVAIGDIHVGLLRGISIDDFIIREKDGKDEFVTMKSFVLRYELLPLLQKKLVVNEIRLQEPTVRIFRNKAGTFNFESLAVLTAKPTGPVEKTTTAAPPLPIALTVDRIRIDKARLVLQDERGELPSTETEANAKITISTGKDFSSVRYQGTMDFIADTTFGDIKPHIEGKGDFDQDQFQFDIVTQLEKERIHFNGSVQNFAKTPTITLNGASDVLDIDHLIGLTAGLPQKGDTAAQTKKGKQTATNRAPAAGIPPGLVARGRFEVAKALYRGMTVKDFTMQYTLDKGILTIDDLRAHTFSGELHSDLQVDLNQSDIVFNGKMGVRSLEITDLGSILARQLSDTVSGTLESSLTFAGAGTEWSTIRNVLTADGSFALQNGRFKNTPVTESVATLLGLPELNDISFQDTSGTFKIVKGGKVLLNTRMNSSDIKAQTDGTVTLDGGLDLPVTLRLSKELSGRLTNRASVAKYLMDEQGETVLKLKLTGTASKPRPVLDTAVVQKAVEKKAIDTISEALSGKKTDSSSTSDEKTDSPRESEVESLFKGLLGR
jgi:uncharacterized protein involved in outer membrane biogenesis